MKYPENPDSYEQEVESSLLSYPKKRELAKMAKDIFHEFFPVTYLTRVLRILKTTSLKSPLQKSLKQKNLMTFCASQEINIWIVFKKTY